MFNLSVLGKAMALAKGLAQQMDIQEEEKARQAQQALFNQMATMVRLYQAQQGLKYQGQSAETARQRVLLQMANTAARQKESALDAVLDSLGNLIGVVIPNPQAFSALRDAVDAVGQRAKDVFPQYAPLVDDLMGQADSGNVQGAATGLLNLYSVLLRERAGLGGIQLPEVSLLPKPSVAQPPAAPPTQPSLPTAPTLPPVQPQQTVPSPVVPPVTQPTAQAAPVVSPVQPQAAVTSPVQGLAQGLSQALAQQPSATAPQAGAPVVPPPPSQAPIVERSPLGGVAPDQWKAAVLWFTTNVHVSPAEQANIITSQPDLVHYMYSRRISTGYLRDKAAQTVGKAAEDLSREKQDVQKAVTQFLGDQQLEPMMRLSGAKGVVDSARERGIMIDYAQAGITPEVEQRIMKEQAQYEETRRLEAENIRDLINSRKFNQWFDIQKFKHQLAQDAIHNQNERARLALAYKEYELALARFRRESQGGGVEPATALQRVRRDLEVLKGQEKVVLASTAGDAEGFSQFLTSYAFKDDRYNPYRHLSNAGRAFNDAFMLSLGQKVNSSKDPRLKGKFVLKQLPDGFFFLDRTTAYTKADDKAKRAADKALADAGLEVLREMQAMPTTIDGKYVIQFKARVGENTPADVAIAKVTVKDLLANLPYVRADKNDVLMILNDPVVKKWLDPKQHQQLVSVLSGGTPQAGAKGAQAGGKAGAASTPAKGGKPAAPATPAKGGSEQVILPPGFTPQTGGPKAEAAGAQRQTPPAPTSAPAHPQAPQKKPTPPPPPSAPAKPALAPPPPPAPRKVAPPPPPTPKPAPRAQPSVSVQPTGTPAPFPPSRTGVLLPPPPPQQKPMPKPQPRATAGTTAPRRPIELPPTSRLRPAQTVAKTDEGAISNWFNTRRYAFSYTPTSVFGGPATSRLAHVPTQVISDKDLANILRRERITTSLEPDPEAGRTEATAAFPFNLLLHTPHHSVKEIRLSDDDRDKLDASIVSAKEAFKQVVSQYIQERRWRWMTKAQREDVLRRTMAQAVRFQVLADVLSGEADPKLLHTIAYAKGRGPSPISDLIRMYDLNDWKSLGVEPWLNP